MEELFTARKNLDVNSRLLRRETEKREHLFYELAYELASEEMTDTVIAYLYDISDRLNEAEIFSFPLDRAVFVSKLVKSLEKTRKSELLCSDFFGRADKGKSFCYVKNFYSDKAFELFSRGYDSAVTYCDSFSDVIARVAAGRSDYGILPYEGSYGRLDGIYSALGDEDVMISRSVTLLQADRERQKAALIMRGVDETALEGEVFLGLKISFDNENGFSFFTSALNFFSVKIEDLSISRGEYFDNTEYSLLLRADKKIMPSVLAYVHIFANVAAIYGIYTDTEN